MRTRGLWAMALLTLAGCRPAPSAPPAGWFVDAAPGTPLGAHRWTIPGKRPLHLLQTIGNGAAFLDADGDGHLDLLLVGAPCALFVGDGKGGFGPSPNPLPPAKTPFQGVAVGDVDNDGDPDLYLSGHRAGALWRNEGRGRFVDATAGSGLAPQPWGTSASFADLDRDGRLDLVVANYVRFEPERGTRTLCDFRAPGGGSVLAACGPREYVPLPAALWRNAGDGRFVPIPNAPTRGRGLGVAVCDSEGDGRPRVAIANDEAPGDLLRPRPGAPLRLENIGDLSGTAYDREGKLHGGMGVDWGDADGDGRPDLAVATFEGEATSLYRNEGADIFADVAWDTGIAVPTRPWVAFGLRFADVDNDGHLDLVATNGHVQDNVADIRPTSSYRQPSQLLRNVGGGRFEDASRAAGPAFARRIVGRGLATGDVDHDGRIDLLLVDSEGAPLLLRNRHPAPGHWIGLKLTGTRSNRDGIGAVVTVTAGGRKRVRHAHADGSYLSSSDPRVHVGIGDATQVEAVEIRWPSGTVQTLRGLPVDRYVAVREGDPTPR